MKQIKNEVEEKEVERWDAVFDLIKQICSEYTSESYLQRGDLIRDLRRKGYKIEPSTINQWNTKGIIVSKSSDFGYPVYDITEIYKAHLAAYLFCNFEMKPANIKIATQIFSTSPLNSRPALHLRDLDEGQRARLILTGRILGICGANLLKKITPPTNTIIICRELDPKKPYNGRVKIVPPADVVDILKPTENLIGWTGESSLDEVFAVMKDTTQLQKKLVDHKFFVLPISEKKDERKFEIVLGPRINSPAEHTISELLKDGQNFVLPSDISKLLNNILKYSIPNVINLQRELQDKLPLSKIHLDASLLEILTTTILLYKPLKWKSAAFYGIEHNHTLPLRAKSPNYSEIHLNPSSKYGPLRWTFANRTHLVVNNSYPNDFRLSSDIESSNQAHAFIPAIQLDECAGVLHVTSEKELGNNENYFTPDDIEILYVLARVIGEAYQRIYISTVSDICQVVPVPRLFQYNKEQLRNNVGEIICDIFKSLYKGKHAVQLSEMYIASFAVRIKNNRLKYNQNQYMELIQQRAYTFLQHYCTTHQRVHVIDHTFRLDDDQLVLVINNIMESEVKEIRQNLQKEFDEIRDINPDAEISCVIWSVHLSYEYIKNNFYANDSNWSDEVIKEHSYLAADDIISKTESALKIIWQVKEADTALARRKFEDAVAQLTDASYLDSSNSYVYRHLSEAYFALSNYHKSAENAQKAIDLDLQFKVRHPSNHRRLAFALFGQGHYADAFKQLNTAWDLSKEVRYRRDFIHFLILHGDNESLAEAQRTIINTVAMTSSDDYDNLAWLEYLRGEVLLRSGDSIEALKSFDKAMGMSLTYKDSNWDILHIKFERLHRLNK